MWEYYNPVNVIFGSEKFNEIEHLKVRTFLSAIFILIMYSLWTTRKNH